MGEVDFIPGPQGGTIHRGETQSLTTVAGHQLDRRCVDDALVHGYDRFLLHYNFHLSPREARPRPADGIVREPGTQGARMLPEDYPYVVRVVSDI